MTKVANALTLCLWLQDVYIFLVLRYPKVSYHVYNSFTKTDVYRTVLQHALLASIINLQ